MAGNEFLLGFDVGSSSVKVTLLNAGSGKAVGSANSPAVEMEIASPRSGWAEQHPETWWEHSAIACKRVMKESGVNPDAIRGIGISYQMHGLVVVDNHLNVLRPSIIWCDSRAVSIGQEAAAKLGEQYCHEHLLNSPGNFTASKLRWVKLNEPDLYAKIYKIMLPGDYLAMRMSGQVNTTVSGLSEGILWDFKEQKIADRLLEYYGIDRSLIPDIVPTFGEQGHLTVEAAATLGLKAGIPIGYRAGDQPNNAFSLKTLHPGEIAATAGTSGVIYGIVEKPAADKASRVNGFAHVNSTLQNQRLGILLCVNGTGIMNRWLRKNVQVSGDAISYETLNTLATQAPIGSDGLVVLPFGNGAERMLGDRNVGASFHYVDLNRHGISHLSRAVQEGIVFSLAYGFEIMGQMGLQSQVVRAGKANMFLSELFCETFTCTTGAVVELYNTDGSQGAARGAGVGIGYYPSIESAFSGLECLRQYTPSKEKAAAYQAAYQRWKEVLKTNLS